MKKARNPNYSSMSEQERAAHNLRREKEEMERAALRRERMLVAFHLQGGKCCHCKQQMTLRPEGSKTNQGKSSATAEHIIPQACGGTDEQENIAAACRRCNGTRGTIDFYLFQTIRSDPHAWKLHRQTVFDIKSTSKKVHKQTNLDKLKLAAIAIKACVPDSVA